MAFWAAALPWVKAAAPYVAGALSLWGGKKGNEASAHEAALNRDFQETMSTTAHQRATQDLQKAGLNRILSVTQGGATTPGGSMAQQHDYVTPAVNTALATKMQSEQIATLREQRRTIAAEADLKEIERDYEEERYSASDAVTGPDGTVSVTPYWRKIIREELKARMAAAKAGQDQPGANVELTKMQSLLSKLQGKGQKLSNEEKELLLEILRKEQPGHLDAAHLWSSAAGGARRRSDLAAQGVRKWLPWGGAGSSARQETTRGH